MSSKAAKPADKHKARTLSDQMRAFAAEYIIDWNGFKAAIRAGYAEKGAAAQASRLLAREDVQELIREKMTRVEKRAELSAERVLKEDWGIATADVNDLVEFRRRCCRHCYGIDFGYQRTVAEMSRERAAYELAKRKAIAKEPACAATYDDFDEKGGIGYDARKPPNPDCQECWGDGIGDAHFKATADLSPAARALYAGVKQTKEGYQMLLIDKNAAMNRLYRHMGLFEKDNQQTADGLTELMAAVAARGSKLPIKGQG
jgi:hypothetical protein